MSEVLIVYASGMVTLGLLVMGLVFITDKLKDKADEDEVESWVRFITILENDNE